MNILLPTFIYKVTKKKIFLQIFYCFFTPCVAHQPYFLCRLLSVTQEYVYYLVCICHRNVAVTVHIAGIHIEVGRLV